MASSLSKHEQRCLVYNDINQSYKSSSLSSLLNVILRTLARYDQCRDLELSVSWQGTGCELSEVEDYFVAY